jgi:hypothetical protein
MLRTSFVLASLTVASVASAFSGSFTAHVTQDTKHNKSKDSFGLFMDQPLFFGLSWWSWSGIGAIYQLDSVSHWARTTQGIDFTTSRMNLGGTAKFQYNSSENKITPEYGMHISVKMW